MVASGLMADGWMNRLAWHAMDVQFVGSAAYRKVLGSDFSTSILSFMYSTKRNTSSLYFCSRSDHHDCTDWHCLNIHSSHSMREVVMNRLLLGELKTCQ